MTTPLTTTIVVNVEKAREGSYIYVGAKVRDTKLHDAKRGSPFANPFQVGKDGTLQDVLQEYRAWLLGQADLVAQLPKLKGRVLGCWCCEDRREPPGDPAGYVCHAQVLADLIDGRTDEDIARERTARASIAAEGLKALTIRQPFAEAILLGQKVGEYRSWQTKHRGPLLIHAATTKVRQADLERFPTIAPDGLVYGAIVGVVEVTDCVFDNLEEVYCWLLANPRRLAEPVSCKGKLNLWEVTGELAEKVKSGLEAPQHG